jgi:type II secretory pathway component GspD/PulD (secretin)
MVAMTVRAQDLQVIELRHRLADEIIPIVTPLLEPGGVLTGADDQLLVRTSPANFAQIRAAVAAIDRALRQLRITVAQGTLGNMDVAGVRGSATIGDDDVQVGVNRPPGSAPGAEVEAGARSRDSDLRNVSTVQTLEGQETFIAVGQSVPIRSTEVQPGSHGPVIRQSTTYESVASGFYGTARLNGDTVILEISPRQQRYRTGRGGVIESGGMTSTVTGRLGEWIELGAVSEKGSDSTAGVLVWGRRTRNSEYSVRVRVEEVP